MTGRSRRTFAVATLGALGGVAGCLQLEAAGGEGTEGTETSETDTGDGEGAPDPQLRVEVVGEQFRWTFDADDGLDPRSDEIVLPANAAIRIEATSRDVEHGFGIEGLGVSVDAPPEGSDETQFHPDRPEGETTVTAGDDLRVDADRYAAICTELCGEGHSEMTADVYVVAREDYADYLDREGGDPPASFVE